MTLCYHTSVDLVKEGELQMRVGFVCLITVFFCVSVLITGCGEEDITEPEAEMVEVGCFTDLRAGAANSLC